ncbi:ATP-binding protein [Natrinema gelatinilyticum]|uniref:ATP-binding protein n=1 Tax=Natrinema gelatinilyticum TaxID=2961571 RepID=UPI0020C47CA5|nr:ATP-binding protein [Natrinema gelatinilyticum]
MTEHPTLSEFATNETTDSKPTSQPPTDETVTMTADERVATYLIEDQMADLTDAIREAVQNGIDSPGSSRVLVSISPERSLILDDGAGVDLESAEGRRNLSVLGAGSKQRSDDETIGEWGIGKGAIIAKGAVRIWSHDTALCFDYRDRRDSGSWGDVSGRDGKLMDAEKHLEGMLVEIDHYEDEVPDPDSYRWRRYVRDLRKRFAYVQSRTGVTVVINGEPVDQGDPLEAVANSPRPSLTRETDDAILALEYTPHEGLDIYSNGLYVTTKREYGLGGVVVSKGNLTLNFARNDIQSGCDRWQRIDDALEQARDDLYADISDDRLTAESREVMIEAMVSDGDDASATQWADRKLFQLATESRISLEEIQAAPKIGWVDGAEKGADKLVERGYIVLDTSDTATQRLRDLATDEDTSITFPEMFDVGEQAESEGVWTGYHRIEDESQLNADQRRYLRFARVLATELGIERDVYYGEASADAWTDSRTYIVITDSAVTSRQRAVWMHDLYLVVLHEAAHETSSRDRPSHGHHFESTYRSLVEDPDNRSSFAELVQQVIDEGFEVMFEEYETRPH